ncbi:acyl-CoA thioesterase [Sneathiella limimaris]|uniref:acyl-CoA thioesterase n=1 Tax=Sneathiella limimaris TaxID=1964213 RepID=UPI00146EA838|nr:thioesterase family protein [Sneathiella limimaris]
MIHFSLTRKVQFQHCDPAGIVFYPRYFEMVNSTVETWFEEDLNASYADIHMNRDLAVPTVHIETDFKAPSRLGDLLILELEVIKLGGSSLKLQVTCRCDDEIRFTSELTVVCVSISDISPKRWPDDIRAAIEKRVKETP